MERTKDVNLPYHKIQLKDTHLQVIVKAAEIILTPEAPFYGGLRRLSCGARRAMSARVQAGRGTSRACRTSTSSRR
jgi:hypothetical protein